MLRYLPPTSFSNKRCFRIMKKILYVLPVLLCFSLLNQQTASAQTARLGIQGILKKANGNAVDDNTYSLRFRLYEQPEGGTHIWEETQPDVEVVGGIYTATLGSVQPLNVPFNTTYYLGVAVGSTSEMLPRIQLTTAPYALALLGNTNQFPSSGLVQADSLRVANGVLARGGAPGVAGANRRGYGFAGADGDTNGDTGMFSTGENSVSLYANNTELLRASGSTVNIKSNATIDNSLTIQDQLLVNGTVSTDLNFASQKGLQYNNLNDWRLVQLYDFSSNGDTLGFFGTTSLVSSTLADIENISYGDFNGNLIRVAGNSNTPAIKKLINLAGVGSFNYVKIKFKYYLSDSWDPTNDVAIAGFSTDLNASIPVICWQNSFRVYSNPSSGTAIGHYQGNAGWSDAALNGEMIGTTSATSFYIFFAMRSDESAANERYGVGNVEVWVR